MKKGILLGIVVLVLSASIALTAMPALAQGPDSTSEPQGQPWLAPGLRLRLRLLDKAASVLEMTRSEILVQLVEGKTVAEIAGDKLDDLVDALLQPRLERLDALLSEDRLTQKQADCLKAFWQAELEERLSQPLPWQARLLASTPSE